MVDVVDMAFNIRRSLNKKRKKAHWHKHIMVQGWEQKMTAYE
jgi:hypothetical protein